MEPAADERATFDAVYRTCQQEVFAFLLARVRDRDEAMDCMQECFLRVWRARERMMAMAGDGRRYWVFAIARNVAIDRARRNKARHVEGRRPMESAAEVAAPAAEAGREDELAAVDRAIARLPEDQRTVLNLALLAGLDGREIGELLGMPPGTVRSTLSRARQSLRRMLMV